MCLARFRRMSEPARSILPSLLVDRALPEPTPYRRASALAHIARQALLEPDVATLLHEVTAVVAETLEAPLVAVVERGGAALCAGIGWTDRTFADAETHLPQAGEGPLVVADVGTNPGLAAARCVREHHVASLAAAVVAGADVSGTDDVRRWLVVGSGAAAHFGSGDVEFLVTVADVLGAALAQREHDAARARAYATLEEEAAISRALLELGQTLHAHLNDPYLLDWVNTAALRLLRSDWSGVLGWDESRRVFRLVANAGELPNDARIAVADLQYRPDEVPRLRALRPGDLLEVASLDDDPVLPEDLVRELRLHAALCTPISCGGEVLGIHVHGWRDRPAGFRPRHRHLAAGIAHAAAVALDTALLVAELQTASRLKSEFLANVSHELRTPINIVAGYTDMLADGAFGAVPDEAAETLARIRTTTRTLSELVSTTLHLGSLEAGRDAVDTETVDVGALVAEIARDIEAPPPLAVRWPVLATALQVTTDRDKLRSIVHQLAHNAVKFTERGSVTVDVEHDGRYLTVTVSDTGIGIAAEHLPMLFNPFHQIDGSNTRRHGGVGLGLHVLKRFVTLLHGDVRVTSHHGEGSTFVVTVPAPLAH